MFYCLLLNCIHILINKLHKIIAYADHICSL